MAWKSLSSAAYGDVNTCNAFSEVYIKQEDEIDIGSTSLEPPDICYDKFPVKTEHTYDSECPEKVCMIAQKSSSPAACGDVTISNIFAEADMKQDDDIDIGSTCLQPLDICYERFPVKTERTYDSECSEKVCTVAQKSSSPVAYGDVNIGNTFAEVDIKQDDEIDIGSTTPQQPGVRTSHATSPPSEPYEYANGDDDIQQDGRKESVQKNFMNYQRFAHSSVEECSRKYKVRKCGEISSYTIRPTDEKPYCCSLCDYKTACGGSLIKHLRVHTGEEPYECKECDYKPAQRAVSNVGMKRRADMKLYNCTMCGYQTTLRNRFNVHMMSHTGEKPFKCTVCDYEATRRHHLNEHMRLHTGDRPYECNLCDYKAAQRTHLNQHIKHHSSNKPYKCTICDYKATRRNHLNDHIRRHTGENLHKCPVCGYRAVHKSLSRHMRRHYGEKPYKCTVCDYKSVHLTSIIQHMKHHTARKAVDI